MNDTARNRFEPIERNMTAQALLFDGKPVGRIVIKFGEAATAFVQIWGASMSTARATGYGYDKASAAVMAAIAAMPDAPNERDIAASAAHKRLWDVSHYWGGGTRYSTALEQAGFTVCNVI